MEKIIKDLQEIVNMELTRCKENKTVPSKEVLDTINVLINIEYHF